MSVDTSREGWMVGGEISVIKDYRQRHTIADVRFAQTVAQGRPVESSPILCSCGQVTTSRGWDAHRGPTADAWKKRVMDAKGATR